MLPCPKILMSSKSKNEDSIQSGTSFWFEAWSSLGCLKDLLNGGGQFDLGIPLRAEVAECMGHRRRNHRIVLLNKIEDEIEKYKENWESEKDVPLWKDGKGKFKRILSGRSMLSVVGVRLCGSSMLRQSTHSYYGLRLWIGSRRVIE